MAILPETRRQLHSGYFIFVRCSGSLSDEQLLELFGIASYQPPTGSFTWTGDYARIAGDGQWSLIMDCWLYTLWYSRLTEQVIQQLSQTWDVFACSVGEADYSFDFEYRQAGRLVRQYIVIDPHYSGGEVSKDEGVPLPGEQESLKASDELSRVLGIAEALGIQLNTMAQNVRVYVKPRPGGV
jgi:hypothetical protein